MNCIKVSNIHFLENFRTSMENKYTLKFTFAIEIQIDRLFTLVLVTSISKFSCKYFSIKCSSVNKFQSPTGQPLICIPAESTHLCQILHSPVQSYDFLYQLKFERMSDFRIGDI